MLCYIIKFWGVLKNSNWDRFWFLEVGCCYNKFIICGIRWLDNRYGLVFYGLLGGIEE